MKVLVLIPARGGSKGIPRKNLMPVCGKPLIGWSIEAARNAGRVDRVVVSTDDEEIASVSRQWGAEVIRRPDEISGDRATSESALVHVLDWVEQKDRYKPDLVVFLQATSPIRTADDIDAAIEQLIKCKADSLFSCAVLDDFCVWKKSNGILEGLTFDPIHRGRRQDREPCYLENGSIYVFRPHVLRKHNNRLGGKIAYYEMPFWKAYEIDKIEDVELCEFYLRRMVPAVRGKIDRKSVDLIVYDFDGVMTDNRVLVLQDGREGVYANRSDGLAVEHIRKLGIDQMILTTETNPVVKARAKKLKLKIIAGCRDKKNSLIRHCRARGIDLRRVVYIGNDLNDLAVMKEVGFPLAPVDADPLVKAVARMTFQAAGGAGVVKELAAYLRAQ